MDPHPDFRELLALFNLNSVEYLVVGGYALAFHGVPRATGDLDILVRPTQENARCVLRALASFGFASLNIQASDLDRPDRIVQLGVPPVRVDLITSISNVSWDEASGGAVAGTFGEVAARYLGRREFISNKRAVGRKKDLADLEALGEA